MESFFFNLAGISITVSLVVVLLLLLSSYLNDRYPVKWRYFIWLILAVRLVIPFDFGLTAPPLELNFNDREISYPFEHSRSRIPDSSPSAEGTAGREGNAAANQRIDADGALPGSGAESSTVRAAGDANVLTASRLAFRIYLAGIAVFSLYQLGLYLSFRLATRRWCREPSEGEIQAALDRLKEEMNMEKDFQIRICKKIMSPMIAGLFKPTLLLPHEEYEKLDLEIILKHELVHFKRNDLWFKLLLIFANALHWFNPFIYAMVREANKDIEISCDEEVLKGAGLQLRKRYSERILELMSGNRPEAPVSTNFHGGKGMMKTRIRHIFDEREKKKGVFSFLLVAILIIAFSACQFDIGQHRWQIPITVKTADAFGQDETGSRNTGMSDMEINMPFDLDQNGSKKSTFSLSVADNGKNCSLKYKEEDGRTITTRVFDGIEPGAAYSLHAANMEGTAAIMFIAAIDYRGMPFGSGYWELYAWDGIAFERVDLDPVEENLQLNILEPEQIRNNMMNAGVAAYLYDQSKYPKDYPAVGLYFREDITEDGNALGSIDYAPMTEYDVEGYRTWGQGAVNKIMTGMNFVSGTGLDGGRAAQGALLETREIVFITLPNITADVIRYYQYQDGKWTSVDGMISSEDEENL